jgi:hypothetical protein
MLTYAGVVDVIVAADFGAAEANSASYNASLGDDTTPFYLLPLGEEVPCEGAHVALVVADTHTHARYASTLARLTMAPPPLAAFCQTPSLHDGRDSGGGVGGSLNPPAAALSASASARAHNAEAKADVSSVSSVSSAWSGFAGRSRKLTAREFNESLARLQGTGKRAVYWSKK